MSAPEEPSPSPDSGGFAGYPPNFTPRALQAMKFAQRQAIRLNHRFIGTEHVLLGLLDLGNGVSLNILRRRGLSLNAIRNALNTQLGAGAELPDNWQPPPTPRVKKVLQLAQQESRALHHTYVGTEHLLLGLLLEGDGVAARLLLSFKVSAELLREEILKELSPGGTSATAEPTSCSVPTKPDPPPTPKEVWKGLEATPEPPPIRQTPILLATEVDTALHYDVHCCVGNFNIVYRKVRFKQRKSLLPKNKTDTTSDFIEIEQSNGKLILISQYSIVKFHLHQP